MHCNCDKQRQHSAEDICQHAVLHAAHHRGDKYVRRAYVCHYQCRQKAAEKAAKSQAKKIAKQNKEAEKMRK